MSAEIASGFEEVTHTADWALRVWAPNLSSLFDQAARGMYWLMETTLEDGPRLERAFHLQDVDAESLLVGFLTELLYMGEAERLAFDRFDVDITGTDLQAVVHGAPVAAQKKEIKAVTYHNLKVQCGPGGCQVTIVFDV